MRQIIVAAVVDQPDAADVDGLLADADFASADIDIGVAQRGQDLRHRDVVGFQFVRIDLDLEFLGRPAPTVDWRRCREWSTAAAHDPVLNRAEIGQSEMFRPDDLITKNFAGRAVLLDCGH